jgi:cytochrome b6-f complex iron-sulfur subunit
MPPEALRDEGSGHNIWSRRELFSLLGWGAVLGSIGASVFAFGRFMFPRVLFEPPTRWKAGFPTDFTVNTVSSRWMDDYRCWIVRWPDQIFSILAVCTHLGCTPRWLAGENKFKCPCHGSGYHMDGTNFEGPAPRPMEHIFIALADDGQLLCDKGVTFRGELGQWGTPGSFVKFHG